MTEWIEYKLKDVADVTMGQSPKSEFYNTEEKGKPFLQGNRTFGRRFPTFDTWTTKTTKEAKAGDVIMSVRAPVGDLNITLVDMCLGRGVCGIRMKNGKQDFLYYLMEYSIPQLLNLESGTIFGSVNKNDINELRVLVPDEETQDKVTAFLKNIDDKIEMNEAVNRNLSEQTEALFQSWFVDLDPWGGEMPVDWKQGVLGDFVTIKRGGSPRPIKEYLSDEGLGWLKISDVTSLQSPFVMQIAEHIKESGLKKTVFLKKGALVLSNSATPGIPKILGVDSCIHDGWLYFPESKLSNEFLYLFFKNIRPKLVALGNGSVFTNLKTDILKGYSFEKPDSDTLREFDELVIPMFDEMRRIARENNKLAELRDSLLPKLMSGELDVSDLNI